MFFSEYEIARRMAEERIRDHLREAEIHRLLRQAGLDQRAWLPRQACRLLSRLGHLLVALGQRLERYEVPSGTSCRQLPRASEASSGG